MLVGLDSCVDPVKVLYGRIHCLSGHCLQLISVPATHTTVSRLVWFSGGGVTDFQCTQTDRDGITHE